MLDFNAELISAERTGGSSVELSYQSSARVMARLDRKPVRLELDGGDAPLSFLTAGGNYTLPLSCLAAGIWLRFIRSDREFAAGAQGSLES